MDQVAIPLKCPLCLRDVTTQGSHRCCMISCRHLFGHSCITSYFEQSDQCPLCARTFKFGSIIDVRFNKAIPDRVDASPLQIQIQKAEEKAKALETRKASLEFRLKEMNESLEQKVLENKNWLRKNRFVDVINAPELLLDVRVNRGNRIAMSSNAVFVASSTDENSYGLECFDLRHFSHTKSKSLHSAQIRGLSFRGGGIIATSSADHSMKIFNYEQQAIESSYQCKGIGWTCEWLDNDLVIVGEDAGLVSIVDTRAPTTANTMQAEETPIFSISPITNQIFACADLNNLYYGDIRNNQLRKDKRMIGTKLIASTKNRQFFLTVNRVKSEHFVSVSCPDRDRILMELSKQKVVYSSRMARPVVENADGTQIYVVPGPPESPISIYSTKNTTKNLWHEWSSSFHGLFGASQICDLSLNTDNDFLLAVLTSNGLKVLAIPIPLL